MFLDDINIINTIIMQNVAFVNKKFVAWFFLNKNKSRHGFWVDMMTMTVMNVNPNVNWISHWQRRIDWTILNENMDALARAIDFHWTIVGTIWIMNRTYFFNFFVKSMHRSFVSYKLIQKSTTISLVFLFIIENIKPLLFVIKIDI